MPSSGTVRRGHEWNHPPRIKNPAFGMNGRRLQRIASVETQHCSIRDDLKIVDERPV